MNLFENLPKVEDAHAFAKGVGDGVVDAAGKAVDAAELVIDTAGKHAGDAAGSVVDAAGKLAEGVVDAVSHLIPGQNAVEDSWSRPCNKSFIESLPMPEGYQRIGTAPDDPEGMVSYVFENDQTLALVNMWPIREGDYRMPFSDPQAVIDGIHEDHGENQGLIEVKNVGYPSLYGCIYSIVKTLQQPSGVQYCLTMHLQTDGGLLAVQAFFEEQGVTGMRESMVAMMARQDGESLDDWSCDPYDATHTRGVPMNKSEDFFYDLMFPDHPLSCCRGLVAHIQKQCLTKYASGVICEGIERS